MYFGLYLNDQQIGFACVVTDYTFFAWLSDVFVVPEHQGKKYGHYLIDAILQHPSLKNVKKWRLATRDAHEFYKRLGFTETKNPEKLMERLDPNI